MNKTLVAALSGIAFGAVLGGIAASNCGPGSHQVQVTIADCPVVTAPACPAVLPPPPPLPASCSHAEASQPEPLPMDVDSQLSRAQTEYVNGNFERTIAMTMPLISQSPERAYRILGAAACNTRNVKLVDRAYSHLSSASRQYLVYTCQRQNISWTGKGFKL